MKASLDRVENDAGSTVFIFECKNFSKVAGIMQIYVLNNTKEGARVSAKSKE